MSDNTSRIRWGRIIGYGLLGELVAAICIGIVLTVYSMTLKGQSVPEIEAAAKRVGMVVGPTMGILFTFFAAILATRGIEGRHRLHGVLVGVVTSLLTVPGMIFAPDMAWIYGGAMLLKLIAGNAGGMVSEGKRPRASAVER